ncbi:D-alanyl-D-alanine carboxypeptidase dacA, partial [Salmonella enterica subsp. enterica serovar Heidelberg str. 622737-14]
MPASYAFAIVGLFFNFITDVVVQTMKTTFPLV